MFQIKNKKSLLARLAGSKWAVRRGMSFMEAIIAMFIFVLVVFSITQVFSSSANGFRKTTALQKNMESAQYAMNLMAKSLRTGTIVIWDSNTVDFFDYSEAKCKRFYFNEGLIKTRSRSEETGGIDTLAFCKAGGYLNAESDYSLASQYIDGQFLAIPSDSTDGSKKLGRATIRIKVCSTDGCSGANNDQAILQTSVSLRDYENVGL